MILPGRTIISRGIITHLRSPALQTQPCGIDLTLARVLTFTSSGTIDFSNALRKTAETTNLPFSPPSPSSPPTATEPATGVESRASDRDSLHLPPGAYLLEFNERVNMPLDAMGALHVRSSLWRSGATVQAGVVDAGYHGVLGALLQVWNPQGLMLMRDARVAQVVVTGMSEAVGEGEGYQGAYQGSAGM